MDPAIASIIAAIITSMASVAVAIITTGAQKDVHGRAKKSNATINLDKTKNHSEGTKSGTIDLLRRLSWSLISIIGLTSLAYIVFLVVLFADGRIELTPESPYVVVPENAPVFSALIISVLASIVAYWAAKRLKRQ